MMVIPAIDIKEGQCVRLLQGDMSTATVYGNDPAAMAKRWQDEGAEFLHLVDLDGAFAGHPCNLEAVAAVLQVVDIPLQVGGGISSVEIMAAYLDLGVTRVVLGTAALENPSLVEEGCHRFPGRVALAVDSRDGLVAVRGWSDVTAATPVAVIERFRGLPLAAVIYTDIRRDGMEVGPNLEATAKLARQVNRPIIASGGVGDIAHIRALARLQRDGIIGVIVGRALYAGRFTLGEAIEAARATQPHP